jgi:hypothetical protein
MDYNTCSEIIITLKVSTETFKEEFDCVIKSFRDVDINNFKDICFELLARVRMMERSIS